MINLLIEMYWKLKMLSKILPHCCVQISLNAVFFVQNAIKNQNQKAWKIQDSFTCSILIFSTIFSDWVTVDLFQDISRKLNYIDFIISTLVIKCFVRVLSAFKTSIVLFCIITDNCMVCFCCENTKNECYPIPVITWFPI